MSEIVVEDDGDIEIEDGSYGNESSELLKSEDGDSDDDDEYIDETMPGMRMRS